MTERTLPPPPAMRLAAPSDPALAESLKSSFLSGMGAVGIGAFATVVTGLPALCPFRVCTGHACPGCGLSRSLFSLLKGDAGLSLRYHPLLVPLAVQALLMTMARRRGIGSKWINRVLWANLALILVVWAVRWDSGALDFVVAEVSR